MRITAVGQNPEDDAVLSLLHRLLHLEFRFQFCDLRLKLFNDGSDLLLQKSLVDMLRAVDVVVLVLKANRYPVVVEAPQCLAQPIVEFSFPLGR